MAEDTSKVFSSAIIRTSKRPTDHYKELINVEPAIPILNKNVNIKSCDYEPKNDKFYIPKIKTGSKVRTVRDVRQLFEKDVYSYLPTDLEIQKNYFLRKIRQGQLQDITTKQAAKKILASDSPVSKSIWRMLININPNDLKFPSQFVLWNGKYIQLNGSRGGDIKFINKYDISKTVKKKPLRRCKIYKEDALDQKKSLLRNSLHIKFKPGPLTKKKYLDTSYQKHNFGEIELVGLPKPGLEVMPTHGKPIPPAISAFLYHSFEEDFSNIISEKRADFAVSVLESNVKTSNESKECNNITFELTYKSFQNKLLMRHAEEVNSDHNIRDDVKFNRAINDDTIISEVKNVINDILGSVEISLQQDNMYTGPDELRDVPVLERHTASIPVKDKTKKRYCELDRLDVRVIRISEKIEDKQICLNSYCSLGCICDSLSCSYNIKGHCGRLECMFHCTCDCSDYQISDFLERNCTSFLPEIVNKDKKTMSRLAKEEQKFHQTVIVTDEKSIVLKSRKRDWKTSKKYAQFYSHMRLKAENNLKKELHVIVTKLDCNNIEPLCLVHNLYRCFCKCRFIDTTISMKETKTVEQPGKQTWPSPDDLKDKKDKPSSDAACQSAEKLQNVNSQEKTIRSLRAQRRTSHNINNEIIDIPKDTDDICARIVAYEGRKYSNGFYLNMNEKIKDLEKNDKTLLKKLERITNSSISKDEKSLNDTTISLRDMLSNIVDNSIGSSENFVENPIHTFKSFDNKRFTNKFKLVSWLESSYKQYKLKTDQGIVKTCLGPPQVGKLALYPWDFILSRYQDRKNFFLVSKSKPFRLFMAVNENKQFFHSCINIKNIPSLDVDKYPITVKNLLTNASELHDNFCILYGLSHCWELIGSVTKVRGNVAENDLQSLETENNDLNYETIDVESEHVNKNPHIEIPVITNKNDDENSSLYKSNDKMSESSKWFVMTVENDFSEIQFYKRGFFVKYYSLFKAINVAKVSNKTVRLSSQKCCGRQSDPQFGIYAIPSEKDDCVFIGPYETDEELGIETINKINTVNPKKRTRGIWITTKTIDNLKVLDNPLSYIPNSSSDSSLPLQRHITPSAQKLGESVSSDQKSQNVVKTIKPIKICKTNGFYHLAPNGRFEQIPNTSPEKCFSTTQTSNFISKFKVTSSSSINGLSDLNTIDQNSYKIFKKPVAEIAPQVKILPSQPVKRKAEGMFVLKPEEINQRSFEGKLRTYDFSNDTNSNANITDTHSIDTCIELDIDNFLATNSVRADPNSEIFIISDDEEDNFQTSLSDTWRSQYIISKNIENLGWIYGRRNTKNLLSFEFPGFKATEFYSENDAFDKINQVFSRKVYVPKNITLEWCTSENPSDVEGKHKLHKNELSADYLMTKKGLRLKSDILNSILSSDKTSQNSDMEIDFVTSHTKEEFAIEKNTPIKEQEEDSELENDSEVPWNEIMTEKRKLYDSLRDLDNDVRQELTDMLSDITTVSGSLEDV